MTDRLIHVLAAVATGVVAVLLAAGILDAPVSAALFAAIGSTVAAYHQDSDTAKEAKAGIEYIEAVAAEQK